MEQMVAVHKWQDQGVGQAPFRFVALISMPSAEAFGTNCEGYNNAMRQAFMEAKAFGIDGLGSCDVCGTGIHHHCIIRGADGKHFKVGCDCVAKTHDHKLMTAVENAERLRKKAIREAKRQAEWEADRLRTLAILDEQRAKNGGLTDSEVRSRDAAIAKSAAEKVAFDKWSVENAWLLDVLHREYQSEFIVSMIEKLEHGPVANLSDRCVSILGDIYAKSFGRRNSKKYDAAYDEFIAKTDIEESEVTE